MLQYRVTPSQPGLLDLSSLLPVQIGSDTSNNFALTVSGLAVQNLEGRFVILDESEDVLNDMTWLTIPVPPLVYRVPTTTLRRGDIVVTADTPVLSALYVLSADDEGIEGLDITTSQVVDYRPPRNWFLNFYVKAISLFDFPFGDEA